MATISQKKRWQYEAIILKDAGKVLSCREMQKELEKRYGLKVNHGTINNDLKKDLEALTEDELKNKKENLLEKLEDELETAHAIAQHGENDKIRLDAMKTVSKLATTKAQVCAIFQKAQSEANKENQPIYNVIIGEAEQVDEQDLKRMEKKNDEDTD